MKPAAALVFLARQELELDEGELRAAMRRTLLLLATGGDPRRELSLTDRPVASLADELGSGPAGDRLVAALGVLRGEATGLPRVAAALDRLRPDRERSLLWLALVLLVEELSEDHPIE